MDERRSAAPSIRQVDPRLADRVPAARSAVVSAQNRRSAPPDRPSAPPSSTCNRAGFGPTRKRRYDPLLRVKRRPAYDSVGDTRTSIGRYLDFYNRRRPHSSLDGKTPDRAYFEPLPVRVAA